MAYTTYAQGSDAPVSFLERIGNYFTHFGHAVFVARGMEARMHRMEELQNKSDAELAEMGLRRDDIPAYVFRDILYI
jgi:ABC-type thiamine transport system ATPase subunit